MKYSDRPMLRLFKYLQNYRRRLSIAVGASITNKIFDLMPPFLTAWLIDTVSGHIPSWFAERLGFSNPWTTVIFLIILTMFIFGFESFFEWMYKRGFLRLAQQVQHDLRNDAYRRLQAREIAYFEEQRTGNLMAMLNDDVNQLEHFLNRAFNEIIQLLTLFIFAGWSLMLVSVPLGLLGMFPIPLIILGSFYYQRKVGPFYREIRERVGLLGARLENNIGGIHVIKSFTAEVFEAQRVEKASADYRDANFKAIRWSAVFIPIIRMFIALGFAGTLLIGAYWVLYEPSRFSLGNLAFFAMMIQRLLWPVTRLAVVFDEYERARASARRIFGLLDAPIRITDPPDPQTLPADCGTIQLENVYFSYYPGQLILNKLNLHIRKGETIGVAGPTGSGKTTLIKLLMRFYEVDSGTIRLDGVSIQHLLLQDLRSRIGFVSQEVYLFHGTIRENIAYGNRDYSMEAIQAAARKAQLHDFIRQLPNGYDSIVGERGIRLSGGQRQRLSIARAILKDAPILILDEATSSVDTETEKAIQSNLHQLTQGKTAVIIAHRLSTIRHADRIIVLKEGKIVESGRHDQLLAAQGVYAELWKIQTGAATTEENLN